MFVFCFLLLAVDSVGGVPASEIDKAIDGIDKVLFEVVSPAGWVNYKKLKQNPEHMAALERYAELMSRIDPSSISDHNQKIALLANAYNVFTLIGVTRAWPVSSVRKIRPAFGFFTKDEWVIGGSKYSLNKLEKKLIRPLDARTHFIINCASASCPVLGRAALRATTIEEQMDTATREFMRDETKNLIDEATGIWRLSKIFEWYREDWGKEADVLAFIKKYYTELEGEPKKVIYLKYDWDLNGDDDY